MSQRTRRLLRGFAFGIFFLLTPLIILTTSGWRWTGWRTGWRQTGVILVTSAPRANIWLNGEPSGQTPKRLPTLVPGTYRLELRRSGYRPWSRFITVQPRVANVIGPVTLWPNALTITNAGQVVGDTVGWLVDDRHATVLAVEPNASGWQARSRWPENEHLTVTLSDQPQTLTVSPHRQLFLLTGQTSTTIMRGQTDPAWIIGAVAWPTWSNQTDNIFFGLQGNQLVRFDTLTKKADPVVAATSFTIVGDTIWFTQQTDTVTHVWRQPLNGQLDSTPWRSFDGSWRIITGLNERLVIQNEASQAAIYIDLSRLSPKPVLLELGILDRLFWPDAGQPPLWQSGVGVYTLKNNRPLLLERLPHEYEQLAWLVPGHSIIGFDETTLAVNSVSDQQGHGSLEERRFEPDQHPLLLDVNQQSLFVGNSTTHRLERWSWAPARSSSGL